jgi:hypothetical protein
MVKAFCLKRKQVRYCMQAILAMLCTCSRVIAGKLRAEFA